MNKDQNTFQLLYNSKVLYVQRLTLGKDVVYKIVFDDSRKPLIITRASHNSTDKFWTSVPEGRQREAEEIGALISDYYKQIQ